MFQRTNHLLAIACVLSFTGSLVCAAPRDSETVELVSTLDIHAQNVVGMRLAQQAGQNLLYLQNAYQQAVMVVDVTQPAHPKKVWETAPQTDSSSAQNIGSVSIADGRGLTYFVDQDGLEIMRTRVSSPTEIEREFEKRLLYDR